ncbi:MAG: pyrroline-5-carboxylate reductase [Chloroflexi bacterium]|nr:pyrroline-5-carboxylate reductase [Chloroflexota bacterium]
MSNELRISFVGGGVMAEAMIGGILGMRLVPPDAVTASDLNPVRRQVLTEQYGIKTTPSNREAVAAGDLVVLAVKPQNLDTVFADLRGGLAPQQVVLSIVAGATIERLARGLEHWALIRTIPNTPAQIGYGITVWIATKEVNAEMRTAARSILQGLGKEIEVDDEKYIDMATAVSGSGPAYVALFVESLIDAGVHVGLPRHIAHDLVVQTVIGSTLLTEKTSKHPAEVRNMVTSPGGTTAEGLLRLEEGRFRAMLIQAVIAAYEKAKLLGGSQRR